jgi:hypothetical protein
MALMCVCVCVWVCTRIRVIINSRDSLCKNQHEGSCNPAMKTANVMVQWFKCQIAAGAVQCFAGTVHVFGFKNARRSHRQQPTHLTGNHVDLKIKEADIMRHRFIRCVYEKQIILMYSFNQYGRSGAEVMLTN